MDFEEQLEKAEKSPYPSLVGASVKSADDSPHKNYIHPEKYTGAAKKKPGKKSVLNSSIGASLDDLISEGALLGSDEDFDRFLDDKGNVLSDAKFSKEKSGDKSSDESTNEKHGSSKLTQGSPLKNSGIATLVDDDAAVLSPVESFSGEVPNVLTESENYSTPNLSEYQIGHQISDHSQLLDSVKSYDLSKLPTADDSESRSKTNGVRESKVESAARSARPVNLRSNSGVVTNKLKSGQTAHVSEPDSLHTPYFHTDERSSSRSRSRVAFRDQSRERSRSRSSSVLTPHLARGDTYKNTHEEAPSKYELPAGMKVDEDEEETDDRRSRQSKPTLGDSLAAAEAKQSPGSDAELVTRDPSLVTSGDYTNFDADRHDTLLQGSNLYSKRSESSTNYLRSISRSRSRKPAPDSSSLNEKNDANPRELEREGALTSDDPYSQVDDLDNMMKKVLKSSVQKSSQQQQRSGRNKPPTAIDRDSIKKASSKHSSVDITKSLDPPESLASASSSLGEKHSTDELETRDAENSGTEKSSKIPLGEADTPKAQVNDISAEEKVIETDEQLIDKSAPVVSAADIQVGDQANLEASDNVTYLDQNADAELMDNAKVDVSAEAKEAETIEQLKAKTAPTVTASDIKVGETPKDTQDSSLGAPDSTDVVSSTKDKTAEADGLPQHRKTLAASELKADGKQPKDEAEKPEGSSRGNLTEADDAHTATEKHDGCVESIPKASETPVSSSISEGADKRPEMAEEPSNLVTEPDTMGTKATSISPGEASLKAPVAEEEFEVSHEELRKHLESLPVYLYTSLAGGMQIITRTNRLATILQANGVKFEHRDLGTDEEAKKLWRRYAQGKTLPGIVRGDDFIGNWEFIEEVNEDYRLKQVLHETL